MYVILNTEKNTAAGFSYGHTETRPPEGIDYREIRSIDNTFYDVSTPVQAIAWLENCRLSRQAYRVRVEYGDITTGRAWGGWPETGYVGRSGGSIKIPILVHNRRSMGGGAILDHCIVRLSRAKGGEVLYQHPNYHTTPE